MKRALILCGALAASACAENGGGIIDTNRTGVLAGSAYVDRDADGRESAGDVPAAGVNAALLLEGTGDTIARATTRADGTFVMPSVPVGRYRLVANRGTLGDTLEVQRIDSASVSIAAGDTAMRSIRIGYPLVSSTSFRGTPVGRRIVIEGIALNGWSSLGDATLHLQDPGGAVRTIRVGSTAIQAGDSIRVLGTTGVSDGRPVLADVTAHLLAGARVVPVADSISTAAAATAINGQRPDALVRVAGAVVRDTAIAGEYMRIGVDDGSGRVELFVRRATAFPQELAQPGAIVSAVGVLAPQATGSGWQIRPRVPNDVTATFPTATVAQIRTMPLGNRVRMEGIALTGRNTFGDATIHVRDNTGAIRAVRVAPTGAVAGDSIRVLGTLGIEDGRLAMVDAVVTVLVAARGLPPVDSVSTATAATAANGVRADGQLRIAGAVIQDTSRIAGDRILTVDDGSGPLDVMLDTSVSFNPESWVPGGTFTGAGVLVPNPTGSAWRLKPRDRFEAEVTFPTMTVAQVRLEDEGRRVVVQGLALNSWAAFGDSTVHLLDSTGALRSVRVVVTSGAILTGDSIRLLGTVGRRNQQPVLTNVSGSMLRRGMLVPEPDSVSTAVARTAGGGARDANQVRVGGTILGTQTLPGGDQVISINDGSGLFEVVFTSGINFGQGPFVPGALMRATGVLVPKTDGTWQLRPRNANDVSATYPTVTIAQARQMDPGRIVWIHGLALNGRATFSDGAVHVFDRDQAIRVLNLPGSLAAFAGDSVRFQGTVSIRNGQPVLVSASGSVLMSGIGVPAPDSLSVRRAMTADNGARDARFVALHGTVASVDSLADGDYRVRIFADGDSMNVFLDRNTGFPVGAYLKGAVIRVRGLLVPEASGVTWEIRPRVLSDVVVTSPGIPGDARLTPAPGALPDARHVVRPPDPSFAGSFETPGAVAALHAARPLHFRQEPRVQ